MPRGLSKIKAAAEESAARRAAYDEGGSGLRRLIIKDSGQTVRVRFLESGNEVWSAYTHKLPAPPGREYGDTILCLDQDNAGAHCPACLRTIPRSERVTINVIWFDAPVFKKDSKGKIEKDGNGNYQQIGVENVVATWETSMDNGGRLEMLDTKHGGLVPHIFEITRRGIKKDTKYDIDLANENVTPTAQEGELFKSKPADPRRVIKLLTAGDMERVYAGGAQGPAVQPSNNGAPEAGAGVFATAAAGQSPTPFGSPLESAPPIIKADVFGA